jgi:hypothetical protein
VIVRRARRCIACAACFACAASASAQAPRLSPVGIGRFTPLSQAPSTQTTPSNQMRTPPLEPARVAGQVLAGAYAGIGGYFAGSWVGTLIIDNMPMASEGTKDKVSFAFGLTGATLATAATVSAIGNIGDQTGKYSTALVGTVGGVAAGLLLNQLLYGHARLPAQERSSKVRWIEASLEAMLPSIGATIAFNSTRRYK